MLVEGHDNGQVPRLPLVLLVVLQLVRPLGGEDGGVLDVLGLGALRRKLVLV